MSDVIFPRPTEPPWGFTQERWDEIRRLAHAPNPPPKWMKVTGGSIVSRAWCEWMRARGRDPKRPKNRTTVPTAVKDAVLRRDGLICQICGGDIPAEDLHIDHVHPVARGGRSTLTNLQATHSKCNLRKGAKV